MEITRRSFLKVATTGTIAAVLPNFAIADVAPTIPDISFIQITDTHIPDAGGKWRTRTIVRAIKKFSLPYELIVHTGDVSNGHGNKDDMIEAKARLEFDKEIMFLPGNHDVTFDRSEKYEPVFEEVFGPANRSFEPVSGLRFALFNSQAISDEASEATKEQAWDRLEQILTPTMPTIFFCHATGLDDFYNNEMHKGWSEETMAKWTSIMKAKGVFVVLAGHFHRDEMHVYNGLPFHIAAPVVDWWGRQSSFRHWVLKDGVLTYRTVYV